MRWLVMAFTPWDQMETNIGLPMRVDPVLGVGFMRVYDDEAQAIAYAARGGHRVVEVRTWPATPHFVDTPA